MSNHYVMDIETLSNCSIFCFEHYKEPIRKEFVIHELRNDLPKLINFLFENRDKKERHISFNGLAFDSQIIEYILRNYKSLLQETPDQVAQIIYQRAQYIIRRADTEKYPEYNERNLKIAQIDVYKLNHWDNAAKSSSLKWIQYNMDWNNIQDMPIHYTKEIKTLDEINYVISYCWNDVASTKAIMHLSKDQINLRANLTREYGINLMSASEPKISKELFLHFLSQKLGMSKYDLKELRTHRNNITVKDIILPYIKFQTETFQDLLDDFKSLVLNPKNLKGSFKQSIGYKGVKTDFGLGGVHGARKSGIYSSGNGMIIMSLDVASFYPNLAIRNGWSPAHIQKDAFCEQYEWFFNERKKIPKTDIRNYVYKIILNSTYGLSIEANNFMYDPQLGMQITINGQLSLMMLYEMLCENIPGAKPLMQNTDGLEIAIPEEYKDKYFEICKAWEKLTMLELEYVEYDKMYIWDVNNYIATYKDPKKKPKCKGRFEFENLPLHKNKSYQIIPKAIYHYLLNDVAPEIYLQQNRNILDYCAGVRAKGEWEHQVYCVDNSTLKQETLQKTLRYYVSEKGCKVLKVNKNDGRKIQLESGPWMLTVMNEHQELPWEQYGIDERYYLEAIYKEINNICPNIKQQLELF